MTDFFWRLLWRITSLLFPDSRGSTHSLACDSFFHFQSYQYSIFSLWLVSIVTSPSLTLTPLSPFRDLFIGPTQTIQDNLSILIIFAKSFLSLKLTYSQVLETMDIYRVPLFSLLLLSMLLACCCQFRTSHLTLCICFCPICKSRKKAWEEGSAHIYGHMSKHHRI